MSKTTKSTVIPRSERKGFAAEDVLIENGESKLDIKAALAGLDPLAGMEVEQAKMPTPTELNHEQFMAQELLVHLLDGAEDEAQFVEVTVNGDYRCGRRGEEITLRRSHVEVLAQSKELILRQKKVTNPDGSMGYEEKMVSRLTYPFSVLHDPAGKRGSDWLRMQLKAAR